MLSVIERHFLHELLQDYVYYFGGIRSSAVRRLYMAGLTVLSSGTGANLGRKWEYLTDLPANSYVVSCALLPVNKNQIVLELSQSDSTSNNAIVYDTYANGFYSVASTTDLSGSYLMQLCRDTNLYAFPTGLGSKLYNPAGSTFWTESTGQTALKISRAYSYVFLAPSGFGSSYTTAIQCTGC